MGGSSFSPALVEGLTDVVDVAAGECHDCLRFGDGHVECMQYHSSSGWDYTALRTVSALHGATKLVSGGYSTLGLRAGGTLGSYQWFWDPAAPLGGLVDIANAAKNACGLKADGTVLCWGSNYRGALGTGVYDTSQTSSTSGPVVVKGLTNVVRIWSASLSTCALREDGTLWCWGANEQAQLGDGTMTDRAEPVPVAW